MIATVVAIQAVTPVDAVAADAPKRPNIIVILSDDMGYSDIGCYGGEIATPTLDQLAAGGVRFTQFYNTARCCPTRASVLTGLYPHQAGVGHMTDDRGHEGYRGNLSRNAVTLSEVLRSTGYRTYMCGKWHVTRFTQPDGDKSNWPLQRGFEKFYGTIQGAGSFYDPTTLCRQNTYITPQNDPDYQPAEYYYTDALSDNASKYIQEHSKESPDKPFFLYLAYTCAHWPMHALEKDIAKYHGKYDAGYEPLREQRLAKMKELGIVAADTQLSPPAESWSDVKNKPWEARCREVYSAMISNMDAGIGRIVDQLKASGEYENTAIFYMHDNGGCAEGLGRGDNGAGPANLVPFTKDQLQPKVTPPMQTRDGRWVKTGPQIMPGPADTYIAYGRGWANTSNTPFREYKHWVHEGGISTPLVAHWPKGIKSDVKGKLDHQYGHLIDIMATCVDLSGAEYPKQYEGTAIKPMEGVSLRPALEGTELGRKSPLFWEHEENRAIREGKWKLVAKAGQPWELYDIDADRIESHDLASEHPKLVQELAAKWDAYAARADVLPLGTWRGASATNKGDSDNVPANRVFKLQAGDELARADAPAVQNRGLIVEAKIDIGADAGKKPSGTIVAQGGSAHGWSLYVADGRLVFALRTPERLYTVVSEPLPAGKSTVTAALSREKKLKLMINGKEASAPTEAAFVAQKPIDGLTVGRDEGGAVGDYESPFPFSGKVESVVVELAPR